MLPVGAGSSGPFCDFPKPFLGWRYRLRVGGPETMQLSVWHEVWDTVRTRYSDLRACPQFSMCMQARN